MVRTTLPMEDKAGKLSAEGPMTQSLVARLESKALDGNLANDDLGLLSFDIVGSEIICQMSSWL
jgi:hypothetical protein